MKTLALVPVKFVKGSISPVQDSDELFVQYDLSKLSKELLSRIGDDPKLSKYLDDNKFKTKFVADSSDVECKVEETTKGNLFLTFQPSQTVLENRLFAGKNIHKQKLIAEDEMKPYLKNNKVKVDE